MKYLNWLLPEYWAERFSRWYLKTELATLERTLSNAAATTNNYRMITQRLEQNYDAMKLRAEIFFAWNVSCDEQRKRDVFGELYIMKGQETSPRLSATGGVHPAARYGFKTFQRFEDEYNA